MRNIFLIVICALLVRTSFAIEILAERTLDLMSIVSVDNNPTTEGLKLGAGSNAYWNDNGVGRWYFKFGNGDFDWRLVMEGNIPLGGVKFGQNVGTGAGIFKEETPDTFFFKSLTSAQQSIKYITSPDEINLDLAINEITSGTTVLPDDLLVIYDSVSGLHKSIRREDFFESAGNIVNSFNTRKGNVLPQSGDYDTGMVPEDPSNLYFTNERVDDRISNLFQNGTGLSWTYNDILNTFTGNVSLSPFDTDDLTEGSNLYYTQARFDSAFTAKSTSDLSEGSNLYYTQGRFDLDFNAKTTSDLSEGTNLYYTQGRFDLAFNAKTTDDLSEGTNLYYTNERVGDHVGVDLIQNGTGLSWTYNDGVPSLIGDVSLSPFDTDDLSEGTNLYYTESRVDANFSSKTTSDLSEGTNLYYTQGRFDSAFTAKSTSDLSEGTNLYYTESRVDSNFSSKTTDDLSEGTNLYFTQERSEDATGALIQNGTGLSWTYNDGVPSLIGDVSLSPFSTDDLSEGTNLYYTQGRFDLAFNAKTTSDLSEGTNLYYTQGRFDSAFTAKSTSDLSEGTNLYYTNERVDDRVGVDLIQNGTGLSWVYSDVLDTLTGNVTLSPFSTSDLSEGTNLYYTESRVDANFSAKTTDDLSEGSNLYYTQGRFDSAFTAKSTSDLSEGTNLYYTQGRFDSAFTAKSTSDLSEGTNLYYTQGRFDSAFTAKSTSDLSEGTNLYYTESRVDSNFSSKTTDDLSEGSSNLYYVTERVEDDVDGLLVAGNAVQKTYNDLLNTLTFDVVESDINHSLIIDDEPAKHRLINDSGISTTELFSASEIISRLSSNSTFDRNRNNHYNTQSIGTITESLPATVPNANDFFFFKVNGAGNGYEIFRPFEYTFFDNTCRLSQNINNFQNYATFQVNIKDSGNYLIQWYYTWSHNDGATNFLGRLQVDGVTVGDEHREEPKDVGGTGITCNVIGGGTTNTGTDQRVPAYFSQVLPLTSGVRNFNIQISGGNVANPEATIYRTSVFIKRILP